MKRICILILALCTAVSMTACGLPKQLEDTVKQGVNEGLNELSEQVKELSEPSGQTEQPVDLSVTGNLIYEKTETVATDADGTEKVSGSETKYMYDDAGREILRDLTTTYDDGRVESSRTENVYDEKGNLKECTYTVDGSVTVSKYTYDSEGRQIAYVSVNPDGSQDFSEQEYDANGNTIRSKYGSSTGYVTETVSEFDGNGNCVRSTWTETEAEGKVSTRTTEYSYNERGGITQSVYTDTDGSTNTSSYEYDGEGRLLKETIESTSGFRSENTYVYDAEGREIASTLKGTDGETSESTKQYDEAGNIISEEYHSGAFSSKDVYRYDENGNTIYDRYESKSEMENNTTVSVFTYGAEGQMLASMNYSTNGVSYSTTYVYDAHGNCVKTVNVSTDTSGATSVTTTVSEYDYGQPMG